MNRIIISTAFSRLYILGELQHSKGLRLLKDKEICVIGFSNSQKEFTPDIKDCTILLIQDNKSNVELEKHGLQIRKETDFFLHHTNANGLLEFQDDLFHKSQIQKGAHEKNANDIYFPLFTEIIFNDSIEDKVSVIIKRFFNSKINAPDTRVKKVFLEYIYNGNLPDDYQIPPSILDVYGINELIQYFKHNPYQKNDKGSDLCSESNIKYVQLMTTLGFKR